MSNAFSLIQKAFRILRERPTEFAGNFRSYFLFTATATLRFLLPRSPFVKLGENVRMQRLRSLLAERPDAKISVGDHSVVYEGARIAAFGAGNIEIGESSILGDIRIASRYGIRIGRRFLSSWNILIQDYDPHPTDPEERGKQVRAMCAELRPGKNVSFERSSWSFPGATIEIGDDVWVGANCTILKGAKIGSGSIVATGAVVLAGEYPARSVIAGNPAKVAKIF